MESEPAVSTKAKKLCGYVLPVTQKSPKQFRFTFTFRLRICAWTYRSACTAPMRGKAQNNSHRRAAKEGVQRAATVASCREERPGKHHTRPSFRSAPAQGHFRSGCHA